MLTKAGCEARRRRLLAVMEQQRWDLFLTADPRTVYYCSGTLTEAPVAFWMRADGDCDTVVAETYSITRVIDYPERELAATLKDRLPAGVKRAAVERRLTPSAIEQAVNAAVVEDATEAILRLRKRKEPDEVNEIRASLRLCAVAYDAARVAIRPGLQEVDVYAAMYAAVVKDFGTSTQFAGDYACGKRCIRGGGPPTSKVIASGDLYVLDLFPAPGFYFADTCRTFAVGEPSALQMRAWKAVVAAVKLGEGMVRPGVRARDVYVAVKDYLDSQEVSEKSFWHHVGHGIGHRGHEAPRIIPASDDLFEEGDVFTLEPGIYSAALQGGIRLEDNYLVTAAGIENLFHYPREL